MVLRTNGDGSVRRFEFQCEADTSRLAEARRLAERFCDDCGFDEKTAGDVGLCVNEAMANVIRHAYQNRPGRSMLITGEFRDQELLIRLRDWGNGVNPEAVAASPHDPSKPGGLGLVCLRSLMDQVHFRPQKQGMLLEMTRKLRTMQV